MKIATDRRRHEVVVRLDPDEARRLAHALGTDLTGWSASEVAEHATALRAAADRLEPLPEPAP